jgi:hypothetical protein
MRAISHADGHDTPGLIDEFVPGVAAVVDDLALGPEDAVGKPIVTDELPDVLDRVEFGALGRQWFARVPHGHGVTMTFLAALRADGLTAPCVIDGPMNGAIFLAWGVQLVPSANTAPRRHRRARQSGQPTKARRSDEPSAKLARICGPAALQPRLEPDRAGLRKAENLAAQSRRTLHCRRMASHRIAARPVQPGRVQELHSARRIRINLRRSSSSRQCAAAASSPAAPAAGRRSGRGRGRRSASGSRRTCWRRSR